MGLKEILNYKISNRETDRKVLRGCGLFALSVGVGVGIGAVPGVLYLNKVINSAFFMKVLLKQWQVELEKH